MENYYSEKLSAKKLKRCYEIAAPRVQQYLKAEIVHVLQRIRSSDMVLELGCGYGRALKYICRHVLGAVGIDLSMSSLKMAVNELRPARNFCLCRMDAAALGFAENSFDTILCIQNGLSAIKADRMALVREAVRVTKPGGRMFLSSYSDKFWEARLEWFRKQVDVGLLGKIDEDQTGGGVIVCKDGFRATTVSPSQFKQLAAQMNVTAEITEVDESSIFCEITV